MKIMKVLNILKTEPDQTVDEFRQAFTDDEVETIPLYEGDVDCAALARISHRVSTADGESRRPAVLVANRAPRRSATTTSSPDSRQTQRILALRRPRHETR